LGRAQILPVQRKRRAQLAFNGKPRWGLIYPPAGPTGIASDWEERR
jgi:hypothetical protein